MPGLIVDKVGGGGSNSFSNPNIYKPFSYQDLKSLAENNKLIVGQKYLLLDYLHQYSISGSNSAGIVTYNKITNYTYGYGIIDANYNYEIKKGTRCVVDEVPENYNGAIKPGDETTCTLVASSYYFKFANGMHAVPGIVFKTFKQRYASIEPDAKINDANGRPILKPGGIINTEVYDGNPYLNMTGAENIAVLPEELILTAISESEFSKTAFSATYPDDELEYHFEDTEIYNDNNEIVGQRKGYIYRRTNEDLNIDLPLDWRNAKFRRFQLPMEAREKLLNQHLSTKNKRLAYQGKYLFTAGKVRKEQEERFYLALDLEGNLQNLDNNAQVTSFEYTCKPEKVKDFTVFNLNENRDPLNVVKCKASLYCFNTVFQNFVGENTQDLSMETSDIRNSTFVSNPNIYMPNCAFYDIVAVDAVNFYGYDGLYEKMTILSYTQFLDVNFLNFSKVVLGTMQNGQRIDGNPTPIPVIWWLYIYGNKCDVKETAIGGVTPYYYLENMKIVKSSLFCYYSPARYDSDSFYQREVIHFSSSVFSSVGLRMTGLLDRVSFQNIYFQDTNSNRANGLYEYDITESLNDVNIRKNNESDALFYERLDAEYEVDYIELGVPKQNAIDLAITASVDNTEPNQGENVVFAITAQNKGENKASEVMVKAALPTGYDFVNADSENYDAAAGSWLVGELAPSETKVLQLTAKVENEGIYALNVSINAKENEIAPEDNSANVSTTPIPVEA